MFAIRSSRTLSSWQSCLRIIAALTALSVKPMVSSICSISLRFSGEMPSARAAGSAPTCRSPWCCTACDSWHQLPISTQTQPGGASAVTVALVDVGAESLERVVGLLYLAIAISAVERESVGPWSPCWPPCLAGGGPPSPSLCARRWNSGFRAGLER